MISHNNVAQTKGSEMADMHNPANNSAWDHHRYRILASGAVTMILFAAVVYHLLEDWSWVDSLYFSTVAVTTVGFGDLAPSTDVSKLFTVVYILAGVSVITTYLHMRLQYRVGKRSQAD